MNELNSFDAVILGFINNYSQMSWTVDSVIHFISSNSLIKSGIILVIMWWGWFKPGKNQARIQAHIVSTLLSCLLAIALARILALSLPFRFRPLHNDYLDFLLPYGVSPQALTSWSSFPSDHAVLFYTLSAGMFYISRKLGAFALIYTTVFVAFPRMYLGFHYPTDILGGALIGASIAILFNRAAFVEKISVPVSKWSTTRPELFYPVFFIISYQIIELFDSSRDIIDFMYSTIHTMLF